MTQITLTRGFVAIIDPEDNGLVSSFKWHAQPCAVSRENPLIYARTSGFLGRENGQRRSRKIFMHRLITGASPNETVDHIDGDGLNNRRANLRHASVSENAMNQRLARDSTTGFKGVSYHKYYCSYCAMIRVKRKLVWLGYYKTAHEAARAYNDAAMAHFGTFARLNAL